MSELAIDADVLILCGGLGARLGAVLQGRPKPMADIHDRPFLDILIGHIASFGFKRFVLCTGYKSEVIEDYYRQKNDALTYIISREKEPLGTAGALKNAARLIGTDTFLGLNGDSFCQADINKFLGFHFSKKAVLSIVLASMSDVGDYGSITLGREQEVIQFHEKRSARGAGLVNAGIYAINREVLDRIPPKQSWSLEYNVFPSLARQGLYGYATECKLFDIGTPEKLEIAKRNFKQ